ncbi:MAG: group II intron reverse transcriptase/maturase [Clostridia bacterium]|nr:group II intron reverse transcriptase/maturase [Clostridia bacterium]
MNGTKDKLKDRKLHNEGYLQMVSAEQKEYAEVSACRRISENNLIITDLQTDSLLEQILDRNNLNIAYKKVKSNKGVGGVDGMKVDELLPYLKEHQKQLIQQIRDGKYKPNPVRRVEIPKEEKGKVRELGIPTVVDRVIQQAIAQILSPIYEKQFSESSYGFRPNRGAHDALKECKHLADEGYVYVVDMDLERFFDTVCQSKLIEVLSQTIKDGRVISLIHKYLNAGVLKKGIFEKTEIGVPQGGPLSPLLSNIMLNELEREIERRGHKSVRYADDCMILCKSRRSAMRTLENIVPFIERKLFLKVNRTKTEVAHISKVKYLGYTFYRHKGKCRFRIHPKTIAKMKNRIRELTARSNGWGNEYRTLKLTQFVRGWVNYFKHADMKQLLNEIDEWLRHRIRMVLWKQWKKVKTKFAMLKHYGISEEKAWIVANMRNGDYYLSNHYLVNFALNNKTLLDMGFPSLKECYLKVCEN